MSYFYEIAYAAESDRLCLFTGTGFSKAVSDNKAPSWQSLLEDLCDLIPTGDDIKQSLFPQDKPMPLTLDESAQVISIELQKSGKSIHKETARLINDVPLSDNNQPIIDFFTSRALRIVTTNYDKLAEKLCGEKDVHSFAPGLPIPRSKSNIKIYHVHGSIDSPDDMVITSDDYFNFFHAESYFSRKLSTVLHENTVVILGYSLGDTNLKTIISDYKKFNKDHAIGSSLIFVSRSKISQYIKDYYSYCFGIRVIDNMDTITFFEKLNSEIPNVKGKQESSLENLKNVLFRGHEFKVEYIRIEHSFFDIIASISASGLSLINERVVTMLSSVIESKVKLTGGSGAWEQYEQLAKWLVHLGSLLDVNSPKLKDVYLNAVLHSMETMRRELYIGYSWHAYKVWSNNWSAITSQNRSMIRAHILEKSTWPDALSIVKNA
ncbi:SIR2 family protein [Aeromonas veronii]|uniref:Uncharacterized protein n=1 Tax=Aeromonas sobria TaxID=646 RepID=A0A2N3J5R1_AERSO|nr:SIR2 family protein [Aeromonas sobria]PKQ81646.1 hypothetical protein CJP16_04110 [Aeromonas sobria]